VEDLITSVEERSKLAGSNHLEALLFSLGRDARTGKELIFGINVFKVRELMAIPEITPLPNAQDHLVGVVTVRGLSIPVIDVPAFCGIESTDEPKILIITEYNRQVQGLLAREVETIERIAWQDIKPPPTTPGLGDTGLLTGIYHMENNRTLMLLDVEKVLSDVLGLRHSAKIQGIEANLLQGTRVFFCDDSIVARGQLRKILDHMGVSYSSEVNGVAAWDHLQKIAERAENAGRLVKDELDCVITDIEMPGMDGYVLTKNIKSDPRFDGVPVIMHSSLSAKSNQNLGENVGADAYVPKLNPQELASAISRLVNADTAAHPNASAA